VNFYGFVKIFENPVAPLAKQVNLCVPAEKSGGVESVGSMKFLEIQLTKDSEGLVSRSLLMTEASAEGGNVLLVFGTSNWLNFVPVEWNAVEPV
jgi:hypothetical protein